MLFVAVVLAAAGVYMAAPFHWFGGSDPADEIAPNGVRSDASRTPASQPPILMVGARAIEDAATPAETGTPPKGRMYFVYRTPYEPLGRQVHIYEDCDSVVDWVRLIWPKDMKDAFLGVPGMNVYGIDIYPEDSWEAYVPLPESTEEILKIAKKKIYVEKSIEGDNEHLFGFTDDDELDVAWFLFSERYAKAHPSSAFWLKPELPLEGDRDTGFIPTKGHKFRTLTPGAPGAGTTYIAMGTSQYGSNLSNLGGTYRLEGVRVPHLFVHLLQVGARLKTEKTEKSGVSTLRLLAKLAQLRSIASLEELFSTFRGKTPLSLLQRAGPFGGAKDPFTLAPEDIAKHARSASGTKPSVRVGAHVLQVGMGDGFSYDHWIIFDDLWAAAHPHLAEGIFRWAEHWSMAGDKR